jgi:hypothetical protein
MTADEIVNNLIDINQNWNKAHSKLTEDKEVANYKFGLKEEKDVVEYSIEYKIMIIAKSVEGYKLLESNDREIVRLVVPQEIGWTLVSFGVRLASECLNTGNQKTFTNALYAFGLGAEKLDIRDVWMALSTVCDVGIKKYLSYDEYFKSGEPFVIELKKYLQRPDIKKILRVMGAYKIVIDKDGKKHYELKV